MKDHEAHIIIHVLKTIADRERLHIAWLNGILDELAKELGITIPERRKGDRRNGNKLD